MPNTATAIIDRRYDDRVVVDIVDAHGVTPLVFAEPEGLSVFEVFDRLATLGWVVDQITAARLRPNVSSVQMRRAEGEGKILRIKRLRSITSLINLKLGKDIVEAIDAVGREADVEEKAAAILHLVGQGYGADEKRSLAFARMLVEIADL